MTIPAEASAKPLAAAAQPAKFLVVGTGGYVVNLGVFAALDAAGLTYILNSIISYFIANALKHTRPGSFSRSCSENPEISASRLV